MTAAANERRLDSSSSPKPTYDAMPWAIHPRIVMSSLNQSRTQKHTKGGLGDWDRRARPHGERGQGLQPRFKSTTASTGQQPAAPILPISNGPGAGGVIKPPPHSQNTKVMADDAAGADADKSPTTLRLLHSTPSTAGLSSHGPVSAGAPTTGGSSIGASPSPGASIDIDIDNGDDDDGELLALRPSRAGSQPRPSCSTRLGPARPLSAPSHSHSSASGQGDGDGDGVGDEYMPTPRTFETAVSSAPRSARQGTFLLASARSHSSSLHSSGYGWYEEDEEDGGGGAHYVGSIGRGHEAHLQVLGRYVRVWICGCVGVWVVDVCGHNRIRICTRHAVMTGWRRCARTWKRPCTPLWGAPAPAASRPWRSRMPMPMVILLTLTRQRS